MRMWAVIAIVSFAACDDVESTEGPQSAELEDAGRTEPALVARDEREPEADPEPEPDDLRSIHERAIRDAARRSGFAVLVEARKSTVTMEDISEGYSYPRTRTELVPYTWLKGEARSSVVLAQWGQRDSIQRTSSFVPLEPGRRYVVFGEAESDSADTLRLLPMLVAEVDPPRDTHPDAEEIRAIVGDVMEGTR